MHAHELALGVNALSERERTVDSDYLALRAEALSGKGLAFRRLVEPYLAAGLRLASRSTSRDLAEDAVQEALIICFERLRNCHDAPSLRAFFFSTVIKRSHTLRRGEARRRQRQEASARPQDEPKPDELYGAEQLRGELAAALEKLSPKRRAAVLLRVDAGLDYASIAKEMGCSENAVRVLVSQGLKALRSECESLLER